jgi:hypothetical protein
MSKIAFASALFLLTRICASAQSPAVESLRGLRGVHIDVLPIDKDAQADGLSADTIRNNVESALRKAGIEVTTQDKPTDGYASLSVVVDTIKHPQGVYMYSINVSILQEVQITRSNKHGLFVAETYAKRAFGLTSPKQMDLIYEPLNAKLKELITDFVSVNPGR